MQPSTLVIDCVTLEIKVGNARQLEKQVFLRLDRISLRIPVKTQIFLPMETHYQKCQVRRH